LARKNTQAKQVMAKVLADQALTGQHDAVDRAPDQEVPRSAVPETADQHHRQQIAVGAHLAGAVAAEGDVDVVAQPGRQ